jgi:putative PIN family toxin of toxin-antitoxin system
VRIVLDTNIVLSALLWQGTPHHLLAAIRQQPGVQLYSSTALLEELADVLTRASAAKRLALIGKSAREVLADYVEAIELAEPTTVPRVVAGDADDDQVIAAAVASRADLIVSGDRKHLLPIGSHQGIAIVEAAEALRRLAV